MKLLTLFSLNDHQPIAFSRQPGNIPDVISVLNALKQLSVLGMSKPLLVLDGGFFSEDNILELIHAHTKFLMRGQLDGKWISPWLELAVRDMLRPSNACPDAPELYCCTKMITHYFTYERKKTRGDIEKGDVTSEHSRLYLHSLHRDTRILVYNKLFIFFGRHRFEEIIVDDPAFSCLLYSLFTDMSR